MRLLSLLSSSVVILVACGGTSSPILDDGGGTDGGGNDSTTGSDGANPPDVAQIPDVIVPDTGLACPNEAGSYSISLTGQGCGDTSNTVTECIQQTACTIDITFGGGSGKGVKGTTVINTAGAFSNAAMEEGSASRTGCVGTWNESTSTLVIVCGGTNTTQSCVATLTRTSATCQ